MQEFSETPFSRSSIVKYRNHPDHIRNLLNLKKKKLLPSFKPINPSRWSAAVPSSAKKSSSSIIFLYTCSFLALASKLLQRTNNGQKKRVAGMFFRCCFFFSMFYSAPHHRRHVYHYNNKSFAAMRALCPGHRIVCESKDFTSSVIYK